MRFHVTGTVCNAANLAKKHIRSVYEQKIPQGCRLDHWLYDAASDDDYDTFYAIGRYHRPWQHFSTEKIRTGVLDKLVPLWRSFDDEDVIIWLDGDDSFAHDRVLEVLQSVYEASKVWMTYGQFIWPYGELGFARPVNFNHPRSLHFADSPVSPRFGPWLSTHLRTFKAGLFKKVKDSDLRAPDGQYEWITDRPVMLPMLEMAGPERSHFISNVLCLYSGDRSQVTDKQSETDALVRIHGRDVYERVTSL